MKPSPKKEKDAAAYIVLMGRVVGTAGETSIRIVVRPNINKFITAYLVKIDGGNSNGII